MIEPNVITELHDGHFQVILDFPSASDLAQIVDPSYQYVWCIGHNEVRSSWAPFGNTLYGDSINAKELYFRNVSMEYLIDTDSFLSLVPSIKQTIRIIQTNEIPPSFIDINRLSGKAWYDLLKQKINYLFEIEIPGAIDYAPIVSSNRPFLEKIIERLG